MFATSNRVNASAGAQTPVRSLITGEIDATQLVSLTGNTRPEANSKNDRGLLPDGYRLENLMLVLHALQSKSRLSTSSSTSYTTSLRRTLISGSTQNKSENDTVCPRKISSRSADGSSPDGFTVNKIYANRMIIDFSGTAGQIRSAFHTELHSLSVNGQPHIANMTDPQIPEALAAAVKGVSSLNDFRPHQLKMLRKKTQPFTLNVLNTNFTFGPNCGFLTSLRDGANTNCEALMPQDLQTIYNINPLLSSGITGKGQTIMVIEDEDPYSLGDDVFARAGLARAYPYGTVSLVHPGGCADSPDKNDTTDDEVAIDMEWASAAAPNAAIQVGVCKSILTAVQNVVNGAGPYPNTMSISYGESEAANGATNNAGFNTAMRRARLGYRTVSRRREDPQAERAMGLMTNGERVHLYAYNISVGGTDFGDSYAGTESTYWNSGEQPLTTVRRSPTSQRFPGTTPAPTSSSLIS